MDIAQPPAYIITHIGISGPLPASALLPRYMHNSIYYYNLYYYVAAADPAAAAAAAAEIPRWRLPACPHAPTGSDDRFFFLRIYISVGPRPSALSRLTRRILF